jgi:hypothetical protein
MHASEFRRTTTLAPCRLEPRQRQSGSPITTPTPHHKSTGHTESICTNRTHTCTPKAVAASDIPIPAKTILPERDYFAPLTNPAPEIPNLLIRVFPPSVPRLAAVMKRRRKRRKRKSAGKTTHQHPQRAGTHQLIKLSDACDCEHVSRQAGRAKIRGGKVRENLRTGLPTHRQKSNLDASLVEPRLFQSFCLCDACGIVASWLVAAANEARPPDPRGRRLRLIPLQFLYRFLERDFFPPLPPCGLRRVCLSGS